MPERGREHRSVAPRRNEFGLVVVFSLVAVLVVWVVNSAGTEQAQERDPVALDQAAGPPSLPPGLGAPGTPVQAATQFTGGRTVRQWLSAQPFDAQMQFGLDVLKQFGAAG